MNNALKVTITYERPGEPSYSPYVYQYPTPAHALADLVLLIEGIEARIDKQRAEPFASDEAFEAAKADGERAGIVVDRRRCPGDDLTTGGMP